MKLEAGQFDDYFRALWGADREPFDWQRRLAKAVCDGDWPPFIDLPTASGKTACLEIAVFALAVRASRPPAERTVGRRIFFVVNRRVIVDQAHKRAIAIATALGEALTTKEQNSILHAVAKALRKVSGDDSAPPLDVAMMRGGIVRDDRWARSVTQPTIITSTVDQVGSRLLFRGYGVSDTARAMHAALIAHDSTILLDEAHISQPFVETLQEVERFRGDCWAEEPIRTPFAFVQMTATFGETASNVFRLSANDRANKVLKERHGCSKLVELEVAGKAKGDERAMPELAAKIEDAAVKLQISPRRNIAIVVNRIATARAVYERLRNRFKPKDDERRPAAITELAIGRMRPLDRDKLNDALDARLRQSAEMATDDRPMFVVATQCLEVGADYDFDGMVCECASLDALRQRFGRLNRTGRDIDALGCIVIRGDQVDVDDDPIYGSALTQTWKWLQMVRSDDRVDFGVNAMNELLDSVDVSQMREMLARREHAPILFPAYLDAWAQTSPIPVPDPDVSLFLHGLDRGEPDVNVCWREDLSAISTENWKDVVSLCPPSSPECMQVPIGLVRRWLAGNELSDARRSDLEDAAITDTEVEASNDSRPAFIWRGMKSSVLHRRPEDLRPGDTVVLPLDKDGQIALSVFGHVPENANEDIAEEAYRQSRGRWILRLWPSRMAMWGDGEAVVRLREWVSDPDSDVRPSEVREILKEVADQIDCETAVASAMHRLSEEGFKYERFPLANGFRGVVLTSRKRVERELLIPSMDAEDDVKSHVDEYPVSLQDHVCHVRKELDSKISLLPVAQWALELQVATDLHDLGKADERFQAYLLNSDLNAAWAQPAVWAKHPDSPISYQQHRQATESSSRPEGFRHEMLSVQLAEQEETALPANEFERALVQHLIAAHHGYARPFAPIVPDDDPPDVALGLLGKTFSMPSLARCASPPHRIDSGIAERFWKLTRRFGWWGLAYLEATLRLADQRASEKEELGDYHASVSAEEVAG
ncbi:MAG: type I-U CRISPR-associated helicase/endonuclease Cas3 [Verrucomicrobiales bacterium]|nr:type I-U CRISPR-associated helicase/endonuclease Cas3 [Verrucomicrobiales bacterium]